MTHTVAVGEFEGPLGILLELVERGRFEVTAISVAEITANYLERIKELGTDSPETLSEFLQLGARLLYIKSLALLPQDLAAEQGEELHQLNLELDEYRRLQTAARELAKRSHHRTWHRPVAQRLELHELPLPTVELHQLAAALTRALGRAEQAPTALVEREHLSLEQAMANLTIRLHQGRLDLSELLNACRNRPEIIVTFLALLELVRAGGARVVQHDQFAPLMVEAADV